MTAEPVLTPTREQLIHALYEAAELEHNLMCTYLYAAFSLKDGEAEGLSAAEAEAVTRWRRAIIDVAIDEMSHLVAEWNITSAIGGSPGFGRGNFPLDPGYLPAGVVVKLAPFDKEVLQHFIHLEAEEVFFMLRVADIGMAPGQAFKIGDQIGKIHHQCFFMFSRVRAVRYLSTLCRGMSAYSWWRDMSSPTRESKTRIHDPEFFILGEDFFSSMALSSGRENSSV